MYRVAKGGAITINSFLSNEDRNIAREHMLKTASTNMREAAKIGLQSLYADPNEVLEKYQLQLITTLEQYDVILLAVAHDFFKALDYTSLKTCPEAIIYDTKAFLDRSIVTARL